MSSQTANHEQALESAHCYQQFAELFSYPTGGNLGKKVLAERQLDFHNSFDCPVNDDAMLNNQILQRLRSLKITGMDDGLEQQLAQPSTIRAVSQM